MKDIIKVSTVAFNAKWGDKESNLNRMAGYIEAAAAEGSNLIVFPEMGLTGYDDEEDKPLKEKMQYKLAETIPGPSSEKIAELAKKLGVYVAYGFPERDAQKSDVIYNAACVCGPEGIIGSYRKIHLPYPEPHWKPVSSPTRFTSSPLTLPEKTSTTFSGAAPASSAPAPISGKRNTLRVILSLTRRQSRIKCIPQP